MFKIKYIVLYLKSVILYSWRFKSYGFKSIVFGFVNLEYARNISIGRRVKVLAGARIETIEKWKNQVFKPSITIGDDVNIGHNFFMTCASKISIGSGVLISDSVAVIDNFHTDSDVITPPSEAPIRAAEIIIEKNVTIYRCATIMGGVRISEGAIIGAYALVKENVPKNAVVAGAPARIVKWRTGMNENK